jgi:hypothetical protein
MELSADTLHEDAALVLCRGRRGTREGRRCLDQKDHSYILSWPARCAPSRRSYRKKSVIATELAEGCTISE